MFLLRERYRRAFPLSEHRATEPLTDEAHLNLANCIVWNLMQRSQLDLFIRH